jgi:DNA-directed RNA polymerase subunit RPC12/RpoP
MGKKIEKQPGKVLMPYYICAHCGFENEMPQYALAPDGSFTLVLNNERGMGMTKPCGRMVFKCTQCRKEFILGLKEYSEPKNSN